MIRTSVFADFIYVLPRIPNDQLGLKRRIRGANDLDFGE
jgi:hypothetical protein